MKTDELEKNLKEGKLESIYLLYGEETYLLEAAVKKIKNLFGEKVAGINYITIDETNLPELINNLEMPAFGFERKLIVVKNSDIFKKEAKRKTAKEQTEAQKIAGYIIDNAKEIQSSNVIVFITEEAEKNDLYQAIEKNGVVCNFEKLKPNEIVKRLKAIVSAYKVKTDDITLSYLIQNSGTGMQELIGEIRKLIEYTGEGRKFWQRRSRFALYKANRSGNI